MSRISVSWLLATLSLVSVGCGQRDTTPADWKSYPLGAGQVSVRAPADYRQTMEPNETLVLTTPGDSGLALRFNLNLIEGEGIPSDVGEQFVRDQAKARNLATIEKGDKVFLTETNSGEENGVMVERRFWQIGLQNAVVVMSATLLTSEKDFPEVKGCLENVVPLVIDSIKKG